MLATLQASSSELLTSLPGTPGPTDGMQTAVHDVMFLQVGGGGVGVCAHVWACVGASATAGLHPCTRSPAPWHPYPNKTQDLSSRAKLSIMAMLLAGLRRAPACDPGVCVPPEGSLPAALALCPLPDSPTSERSA